MTNDPPSDCIALCHCSTCEGEVWHNMEMLMTHLHSVAKRERVTVDYVAWVER